MPKSTFFSPSRLALLAMLTAGSIVLSRLCVIYFTPSIRVEFGSIPIFLAGLFFGPVSGVIVGGLADVLAKMLWTTYWLNVLYGTGFLPLLTVRVPLYLALSLAEGFVVFRLVKSGAFRQFCQAMPLAQAVPTKGDILP